MICQCHCLQSLIDGMINFRRDRIQYRSMSVPYSSNLNMSQAPPPPPPPVTHYPHPHPPVPFSFPGHSPGLPPPFYSWGTAGPGLGYSPGLAGNTEAGPVRFTAVTPVK